MAVITAICIFLYGCKQDNLNSNGSTANDSFEDYNIISSYLPKYLKTAETSSLQKFEKINNTFSPSYLSINTLKYDNQHYQLKDKNLNLYNLIQHPDKSTDYTSLLSLIVSILAFIASIVIPLYLHKKQKADAINDEFWLREVILPKINGLIFKICADLRQGFSLDTASFSIHYQNNFLPILNELRDDFEMLNSFPMVSNYIDKLEDHCDILDNDVSSHESSPLPIRIQDISKFNRNMLAELISIHKKI